MNKTIFYFLGLQNMTKKLLLLTVLAIFFVSALTLGLILNYLDPFRNEWLSYFLMGSTFFLSVTSLGTIVLYFFKKVYYRGEVFISHIFSTLRQSALIATFFIGAFIFLHIGVLSISTFILLGLIIFFFELLFQHL